MVPSKPHTTNCLLFQLILLESDLQQKDYTVGWGVFPLVNESFNLNEGKFKVPLLFGNVDPSFDRYQMIEEKMMRDLDSWTCNLYFEIEKVKLMDLKLDERSLRLYYKPVVGESAMEIQQMVNYGNREDLEERAKQNLHS